MKKQFIKEVVLKKLEGLISEVGEFNYNKNFTPTDAVAQKAKQALAQIANANHTTQGTNQGSGREKAAELAEKKSQSINQMKKMANFFSTNAASIVRIKQQGGAKTDQEKGLMQAWDLHGGEAGNQWVKNELKKFHDENLRTKSNLRKAGGAGTNKGMGIFDTSIMDTTKQRIHR
jgi:hypothetical protein